MDDDQQFCLRWNNHQSTLIAVFDTLLEKGIHVDCTLAAEGQTLKAHKVVLSACSPYFENVLSQQYDKHPIIILKDVKYAELRAMMDYMYRGEVNISQDQLAALLKAAESLQIKGLSDNKPARQSSPAAKVSEGACSREGSVSPSRRRKKARRASAEGAPVAAAPPAVAPAPLAPAAAPPPAPAPDAPPAEPAPDLKLEEGSRGAADGDGEGVEDLTLDEENEEPPPPHSDVVRNFQWHMERSQDEMMNADGARDSQGSTAGKKTDPSINKPVKIAIEKASTFAVLKNVVLPNEDIMPLKPDHSDTGISNKLPTMPAPRIDAVEGNRSIVKQTNIVKETIDEDKVKKEEDANNLKKVNACDGETIQKRKRGRPPKKDKGDLDKKGKFSKKGKTFQIEKKDRAFGALKEKKDEVKKKKEENYKDEKKTCVYDFDYFSNDSSAPLPCSEYKSDNGYKCPNCQRCYNARKNLVRHITLECGREPQYQCPHCPYSKHRRNELKKHIQKKHANEPERAIKRKH